MKNLIALLVLLCTLNLPANATNVSGAIHNNTNWTLANSPYIVTSDIVIFPNATLTIDAGVEVLVDSTVKIEVRGNLKIQGTAQNEVIFKGNTNTNNWGFWRGFEFRQQKSPKDSLHNSFIYCRVSNAGVAFNFVYTYGPYYVKNSTFTYNHWVSGTNGGAKFDSCTFKHSSTAIFSGLPINCVFDSNAIGIEYANTVENCKFTNHSQYAIGDEVNKIIRCEITNNNIGINLRLRSDSKGFDNIISGNDTGIYMGLCYSGHNFINNKICNNTYNIVNSNNTNCDLPNNCWCTMDSTTVRGKIHDGYNDIKLGLIDFMPMKSVCNPTSVPGMQSENLAEVNVYPNPNNGTFTIQLTNADFKNARVKVYDIMGRECYKSNIKNSESQIALNQPKGIYLIKLQLDETTLTKRVILE